MNLKRTLFSVLVASCAALTASPSVFAADHGDSPRVRNQGNLDINDVYLFNSPTDANNVVIAMTVSPIAGITGPLTFNNDGFYELVIDNNGDAKPDILYTIKFSKPAVKNNDQTFTVLKSKGNGFSSKKLATGHIGFAVPVKGGGSVQADDFDDPFFFDLLSFKNGLKFCTASAENFFTGLNTLAIVLEVPKSEVQATGSTKFGVWGRTFETTTKVIRNVKVKSNLQFDRMGRPAINTVLVKAANKDAFNRASPITDAAKYKADGVAIMQSLGNTASGAQAVGDILFPDILTFDSASTGGFPNGRKLTDDVIDTALQLVTGNNAATDCIGNDSTFRSSFPYLGVKNP